MARLDKVEPRPWLIPARCETDETGQSAKFIILWHKRMCYGVINIEKHIQEVQEILNVD